MDANYRNLTAIDLDQRVVSHNYYIDQAGIAHLAVVLADNIGPKDGEHIIRAICRAYRDSTSLALATIVQMSLYDYDSGRLIVHLINCTAESLRLINSDEGNFGRTAA